MIWDALYLKSCTMACTVQCTQLTTALSQKFKVGNPKPHSLNWVSDTWVSDTWVSDTWVSDTWVSWQNPMQSFGDLGFVSREVFTPDSRDIDSDCQRKLKILMKIWFQDQRIKVNRVFKYFPRFYVHFFTHP